MGEDVQFILTLRGQLRLRFQIKSGIDSQQRSYGLVAQRSLLALRYESKTAKGLNPKWHCFY